MSEGLAQLASRGRRTRDIPPPRNPARSEPVPLPATPEAKPGPEVVLPPIQVAEEPSSSAGGQSGRSATSSTTSKPEPESDPVPLLAATEGGKVKAALKVVTVYLEQDDDDFLEAITHTGRTTQPKTAISRSAVVRLALERLHAQLSPNEIVNELRPRGDQHGTGRKRR